MNKIRNIIATILVLLLPLQTYSESTVFRYHRNSLATVMVYHEFDDFGYDIAIAFDSIKTPDKYNDHNIGLKFIRDSRIRGVKRTEKGTGLYKDEYGKVITPAKIEKNAIAILSVLNEAEYAKRLVEKWFDFRGDSLQTATFDMDLIKERGEYNANDIDISNADKTIRQRSVLSDAGEELISHTYVIVNDISYVTAEERGNVAKIVLTVLCALLGMDSNTINNMNSLVDSFTGFTVKVHSYLYQLDWNDEIASIFYNSYYTETPNPQKIKNFLNDNSTFSLRYVGHEYECDTKTVLVGDYDRKELIKTVCARALDKNIAELQKKYEPFRIKTPIISIEQADSEIYYNVNIGLKEGISDKSIYKVILPYVDPQTNRTKYKQIATVKPINGKIWDNRYNAVYEASDFSEKNYTSFRKISGGDIIEGMLITEQFRNNNSSFAESNISDNKTELENIQVSQEDANYYYLAFLYKTHRLKFDGLSNSCDIQLIKKYAIENSVLDLETLSANHESSLDSLDIKPVNVTEKVNEPASQEDKDYYYLALLYKTRNLKDEASLDDYNIKKIKRLAVENSTSELETLSDGHSLSLDKLGKDPKNVKENVCEPISQENRDYFYLALLYKTNKLKVDEVSKEYDVQKIKKIAIENTTSSLESKSLGYNAELDKYINIR